LLRIRESFAAKLLAGLACTVGLLLLVTFTAVRLETNRQEIRVSQAAVASASAQFAELEKNQRQQTDRLAAPLVDAPRAFALVQAALQDGTFGELAGRAVYDMNVAGLLGEIVVAFTDAAGAVRLTILTDGSAVESDPIGFGPFAEELIAGTDFDVAGYVVMGEGIYNVRVRALLNGVDALIGTVGFALPVAEDDLARIGSQAGVEACLVMANRCLVGTPQMSEPLRAAMEDVAQMTGEVRTTVQDVEWSVRAVPFRPERPEAGARVIAVPLDGVRAPFRRITSALVFGGGGALALSLLFGMGLSRGLTRPVHALVDATGRVARGEYDTEVPVTTRDEIGTLASAFNDMTRGLLLKERYRSVLNKVVSQDVAEELMKGDVELGGENRRVTVLFADIRGFTALTDGMEPQEVIGLLNECMERLSAAVEAEGGVVDKYVGDELMAVFGAPVGHDDDALRAVRSAVRMREAVAQLNAERGARGDAPIGLGVGVSTGLAVAGNMGSRTRLNYTVLGDIVNLGSRLCSGAAAGEILVSEQTLSEAGASVVADTRGERAFKGFSKELKVFAVQSLRDLEKGPASLSSARIGSALVVAIGMALAGGASPASAQDWPTLSGAGLGYLSDDGSVQVDVSGKVDLEVFRFSGHDAGLAYGRGTLVAPRLRLFGDLFVGSRLYALVELRADRGEAPTSEVWEARVEQVFMRLASASGSTSIQAGRFASPFGSYAARHDTDVDPFVRPPLFYDYRTIISRTVHAPSAGGLLTWKNRPGEFRIVGAPPIWNVPYQWGAMLSGSAIGLRYRVATMNSAPSSEVDAWGWNAERMKHPSVVLGVQRALSAELSVGLSLNRGPYVEPALVETDHTAYKQTGLTADFVFARGSLVARGELLKDHWDVPNLAQDLVEWGYNLEAQIDVAAGVSVSGRLGLLDFRPLNDGLGTASPLPGGQADWDYDTARYEFGMGYRLARNAGLLGSFMHNVTTVLDPDDDLWSVRLWWRF